MPRRDEIINGVNVVQEVSEQSAQKSLKRKRNKLKRKILFTVSIMLILIATIVIVSCRVKNYTINSNSYYTPEEIVEGSEIDVGKSLIFLDVETVEKNLFYKFPYIESFEITKVYPNTVDIVLTEAEKFYSVYYKTSYVIVSKTGKFLGTSETIANNTAVIEGGDISDINGYIHFNDEYTNQIFKDIHLVLSARNVNYVTKIDISDIDNVKITYDDRVEILLGSSENISYKLRTAFQVLDSGEIKDNEYGTLDVSLDNQTYSAYFKPILNSSSDDNSDNQDTDDNDLPTGDVETNGRGDDIPDFG